MTLSQLLSLVGAGLVTGPLQDVLNDMARRKAEIAPEFQRAVACLLAQAPDIDLRLRMQCQGHVLEKEIIRGVLEFIQRAGDAGARRNVPRLAASLGVSVSMQVAEERADFLTASQQAAFQEICALAEIFYEQGNDHAGVTFRIAPLLIGPSGVGKTHVVTAVGRAMGLSVVRLTVGDWIIQAARQSPCAFELLQNRLDRDERFILFIDELDKLKRQGGNNDYTLFQQVEIFATLDRSVSYPGAAGRQWTEIHDDRLRRNVMVVGGGTWHDIWVSDLRRPMGFDCALDAPDDIANKIRRARTIPEELLNRFSDRWLLLRPYSVGDFQMIAERLHLGPEDFSPEFAVASGGNFRAVQNALTARALKQHYARKQLPCL